MITHGKCTYCSRCFSSSMMARHLDSCKVREDSFSPSRPFLREDDKKVQTTDDDVVLLLKVSSKYFPEYWLFIETYGVCKLIDIDSFLRNIWLECCGHLSCFTINNERYEVQPDPMFNSRSMRVRLNKILQLGMIFEYVYDYGSSTELVIKVVSSRCGRIKKGKEEPVRLIAGNDPIVFKCHSCKQAKATNICTICLYEKNRQWASLCENCMKQHECKEKMFLPIVNSPRSGECGYTGESGNK
jgi:hypothetical protein